MRNCRLRPCHLALAALTTQLPHGLNERKSVRSVYVGRDFLTDLVKLYAEAP